MSTTQKVAVIGLVFGEFHEYGLLGRTVTATEAQSLLDKSKN